MVAFLVSVAGVLDFVFFLAVPVDLCLGAGFGGSTGVGFGGGDGFLGSGVQVDVVFSGARQR